jgi:hypothetical protein
VNPVKAPVRSLDEGGENEAATTDETVEQMWSKGGRATAYNGSDLHTNRTELHGELFKIEHRRWSG